jgi:hypothetical protein
MVELPLPLLPIARFFGTQQSAVAEYAVPQETSSTTASRLLDANTVLLLAAILIATALLAPPIWGQESLLEPLAFLNPFLPTALALGERATGSLSSAI